MLEKLAINQVNLSPKCFSIIVINDSLVQEVAIFGSNTNVFDEYLFYYFYFSAMKEPQLRRVMRDLLEQHYQNETAYEELKARKILESLPVVFNDFFNIVFSVIQNDTVNVNEFSYFFLMLIEQYMAPAVA